MVDGVNGGQQNQNLYSIKGQKGKSIDLNQLEGLEKTTKNEALFNLADGQNGGVKDGKLDANEASWLRAYIQNNTNNHKISKREMGGKEGYDALMALADQQEAAMKKTTYEETNQNIDGGKNTIKTKISFSNFGSEFNDREDTITSSESGITTTMTRIHGKDITETTYPNGCKIVSDGTTETFYGKDGIKIVQDAHGNKITYKNDKKISCEKDGNVTTFPDENSTVTVNSDGKKIKSTNFNTENKITTTTNYSPEDGSVSSIETSDLWGDNVSRYGSEEDMKNNRPSETITNANNPTLKTTTTYQYDDKGNILKTVTNSAGEKTTTYTNSKGETIPSNQFDAPENHTVEKGESITKIVSDALIKQGFSEDDLKNNPELLKNARKEFIEANTSENKADNRIYTYNGKIAKYKGNQFVKTGEKVIIPNFSAGTVQLDEVTVTAKAPSEEMKQKRQELQAKLGDDYEVGYTKDGNVEIRDKNGNVVPEDSLPTKNTEGQPTTQQKEMMDKANAQLEGSGFAAEFDSNESKIIVKDKNGNIDPIRSKLANFTDEDDMKIFMNNDINKDGGIDKKEYNVFFKGLTEIDQSQLSRKERRQLNKAIKQDFKEIDTNGDGKITKQEYQAFIDKENAKIKKPAQQTTNPELVGVDNPLETRNQNDMDPTRLPYDDNFA